MAAMLADLLSSLCDKDAGIVPHDFFEEDSGSWDETTGCGWDTTVEEVA
jgi:hypothetical protein